MDELLIAAHDTLARGERVALVTLIRSFGSTPRHKSARLVVWSDGRYRGSIGGGTMELQAIADARTALEEDKPRLVEYNLNGRGEGNVGLCGGTQQVFVDILSPESNHKDAAQLIAIIDRLRAGEPAVLATVIQNEANSLRPGAKMVVGSAGSVIGSLGEAPLDHQVLLEARKVLADRYARRIGVDLSVNGVHPLPATRRAPIEISLDLFEPQPRLLIIGAGHIGAALAKIGKYLGWWVSVLDDRPAFATRQNLPDADEIRLVDYEPSTERLGPLNANITPDTAVVVATWGWDEPALLQLAGSHAFYVGLVASSRKAIVIFDALRARGIDSNWLEGVRVPVGLDLGAETPEEIALSIMAEVLAVSRRKSGTPLREIRSHLSSQVQTQSPVLAVLPSAHETQ
jgi:xanthine dehydrogenase accessory factor